MSWLRRHLERNPPDKKRKWRYSLGSIHNYFHQGIRRQEVSFLDDDSVPVVEVWATERGDTCEVKIRCNEASLSDWFQSLRLATTEKWPEPMPLDSSTSGGLYGSDRDLTIDQVRDIVRRCREYTARGGKVTEFYRHEGMTDTERGYYSLETLRGWLKDPRFRD